jgi:hypothetical protein
MHNVLAPPKDGVVKGPRLPIFKLAPNHLHPLSSFEQVVIRIKNPAIFLPTAFTAVAARLFT